MYYFLEIKLKYFNIQDKEIERNIHVSLESDHYHAVSYWAITVTINIIPFTLLCIG